MKKFILMLCGFCLAFACQSKAPAQTITNQPQSLTVNNASTAAFTVGASNATSYQWQLNGTNLSDTNFDYGGTITGSTNATLTLEDVMTNQAGSYTVIVSNSLTTNSVTSSNAILTLTNGTIVTFTLTNFLGGGASNVTVQLFDHDKPATVQNFLHYINAGAYTNMFFDRCSPQFVLQGGDDGAADRTNTSPTVTGWDIASKFTTAKTQPDPPFPPQVDSEFNLGPLIHNRFGTVAMALHPNNQNSASSAFFFNLTDNSANLDFQTGGFTVFGRILDGTNVLQYFYGLTIGNGIVTSSTFLDQGILNSNQPFSDLPVDYHGSGHAANSNLVFCDFSFVATLPPDTNPPTVLITSPASGTVQTNGTLAMMGAAQDDVGLSVVICMLNPQAAGDGTYPMGGVSLTNYASGTISWSNTFTNSAAASGSFSPGTYNLTVEAQNGAGYLSAPASQPFIITAILVDGGGTATLTNGAFTNLNAVGYPFQNGSNYSVEATPDTGHLFVNWSSGDQFVFNPSVSFRMAAGFVASATFISNGMPNGIAFTYPTSNAIISTDTFNITGTIGNVPSPPVTVTCQIYSTTTYQAVGPPLTNAGTGSWSVSVATNLPIDTYIVEAMAVDANGDSTVITQNFSVAASYALQLQIVGPGTVLPATVANGEILVSGTSFQATAIPNPGQIFYTWSNATGVSINPVQSNIISGGLTLTATFVSNTLPNSIAFTSPPANVVLSNGTVNVAGMISNVPSLPVTVTCQIFSQSNLLAVSPAQTTTGTNNWSIIVNNLVAGSYIAVVKAVDNASNSTVITESFSATVNTNIPAVLILSPATNVILTDDNHITASGTASNNVAMAWVTGYLIPQKAADGTLPNGGSVLSQVAVGTTNWSIDFGNVPPGVYSLSVEAMDVTGNLANQTETITNTAIVINGSGRVNLITQAGVVKSNVVGYPLQNGVVYQAVATPGAGQIFLGWTAGTYTSNIFAITFTMSPSVLWTVTFVPETTGKGIAFTHPTDGARLTTNAFLLKGTMAPSFQTAGIYCQITSLRNGFSLGPLLAENGAGTWSVALTNLPPGNYVVEAAATNSLNLRAVILEKFTIAAFAEATGTYSGLFICTNSPVAPTNSGFLTFTVGPSGAFSGRLVFPAYAAIPIYATSFKNIDYTTGYYPFAFPDFYGHPLQGAVYLDLSGGTGTAFGTISSDAWSSQLICLRAVTKLSANTTPATGKYILSLQPGNQTTRLNTNGYATLDVAQDGVLTLSGVLPDNAAFSGSARVSQDGVWPFYVIPAGYHNKGMLLGWESFTNQESCSGQLYWCKAPQLSAYYAKGVGIGTNMPLNAAGTNCSRPATNSHYAIVFAEGTNVPLLTNILAVNSKGQFVVSNNPSDLLKISLSANSVITGTVLNTTNHTTQQFKGAFISPSQGGSGFIPEPNGQTGSFELQLEPQ